MFVLRCRVRVTHGNGTADSSLLHGPMMLLLLLMLISLVHRP
jgi:hypothetical protein